MNKELLIISGISGGGKTTASNILEDMGYLCIDQYPVELLENLISLIKNDNSVKYSRVALSISIENLNKFSNLFNNSDLNTKLILVDCDKDDVINRYKFSRRIHPLILSNKASTIEEAYDIEKGIFELYKKNAHIINTSNLSIKEHTRKLSKIIESKNVINMSISFVSFGYKNGVPDDADMVFDVRMLDNPFYVDKLKKKTGNDKPVKEYVLSKPLTQRYIKKLVSYIDFTLKTYGDNDKHHLTICIGCTGGQHRSVTIANYLYNYYKDKYMCYLHHRELD